MADKGWRINNEERNTLRRTEIGVPKALFSLPIDAMPIACIVWSPELTVLSWNPAAQRAFGYPESEVLGRKLDDLPLVPVAIRRDFSEALNRVLRIGRTLERENESITKDGRTILCQWTNTPFETSGGIGVLSMAQDIETRFHVVRELLLDGKRLERLLALSQSKPRTVEELLAHSLDEAVALTSSEFGCISWYDETTQHFTTFRSETPEEVLGSVDHRSQIEQVVMNIVVNARDAMPTGGSLMIETSNLVLKEGNLPSFPEAAAGEYVLLSVRDTGTGMPEEIRAKIFEPFFTTKPSGKGAGLGLAMVYGVVRQCGAFIACESRLNEGTAIRILFPRTTEAEAEEKVLEQESPTRRGNETILVVEDNDDVRRIAESFLAHGGYRVLVAEDGEEAVRKASLQPIDLLLTDVVMPGLNGKEVSIMLQKIFPNIRVVFMSGYPSGFISHHGVLDSAVQFIQKPFTRERLLRQVREALDRGIDKVSGAGTTESHCCDRAEA